MHRTEVDSPNYYHQVVDCQWACPAHTNVPEYIRLIAQGRFDDSYMLNRESNVFPAILGRTCDRPCDRAAPGAVIACVAVGLDPDAQHATQAVCLFVPIRATQGTGPVVSPGPVSGKCGQLGE